MLRVSSIDLALSLNLSMYVQAQDLTRRATGERSTRGKASDYGIGPEATVRFPAVVLGLRPVVYARYDRVLQSGCDADAACYGDRDVASLGVGVDWAR